jgi:hypothetical protein
MFKDVLNHAHLSIYAEIGLVIFAVVFVSIVLRAMFAKRSDIQRWSEIPLDDSPPNGNQR